MWKLFVLLAVIITVVLGSVFLIGGVSVEALCDEHEEAIQKNITALKNGDLTPKRRCQLHMQCAYEYAKQNNKDSAAKEMEKASRVKGVSHWEISYAMYIMEEYINKQHYEEARMLLEEALTKDLSLPTKATYRSLLARLLIAPLYEEKDPPRAIELALEARRIGTNPVSENSLLAQAYMANNDPLKAQETITLLFEQQPVSHGDRIILLSHLGH